VLAPLAVKVELPAPEHIAVLVGTTLMVGFGFIVILNVVGLAAEHPLNVGVTDIVPIC